VASRSRKIPVASGGTGPGTEVLVSHIVRESAADGASGPDPDHHLWRNGRLWWVAFTVHRGHLQERLRFSLRTDDVAVARKRRDDLFALFDSAAECRISLRFRPRRGGASVVARGAAPGVEKANA